MKIGIDKNSKLSFKTRLATRINLFLGHPLVSVEQYRHAFKTQRSWNWRMSYLERLWHWLTARFYLEIQEDRAKVQFRRWLEMVSAEGQAKEVFFTQKVGLGLGEEFTDLAALKWLGYLTDVNNAYHRKMVAKLADLWMRPTLWLSNQASEAHKLALARRMEFARQMLEAARDEDETRAAYVYIYDYYGRDPSCGYRGTPEFQAAFDAISNYGCAKVPSLAA